MKHLLLLHGAIGSKKQLEPLRKLLSNEFIVHPIDFPGHGGTDIKKDFSIKAFAENVLEFMKAQGIEKVSIFGYSMGGYVGLYLARFHPHSVDSIVTLGTKLHWDKNVAAKETAMLVPKTIAAKVPKFAQQLERLHHPKDWKLVVEKTAEMLSKMGAIPPLVLNDFSKIHCNVLLMLGDRDRMVSVEETIAVYKQLPNAQMAVLPGTPHPIEQVNTDLLALVIKRFYLL